MNPSRHPIGVSSRLFHGSAAAIAGRCRSLGLSCVRLAPGFPGLPFSEPAHFTPERCRAAADPFRDAGLSVACLSADGSLVDPHLPRRQRAVQRLHALLRHARDFGTSYVVTETGSPGPDGSRAATAWTELRLIVSLAAEVAADHGAALLLKAEPGHVLATAEDAVRLADEVGDPRLGFVMDPAAFLVGNRPEEWAGLVERLFERLGSQAPVVFAKDVCRGSDGVTLPRAGLGGLDYRLILRLLDRYQPAAPVIMEHLGPDEVEAARRYLAGFLNPS
jgi:sugar phosphate isomerase/epimerase